MKEESAAGVEADAHRFACDACRFFAVGHDRRCVCLFVLVFEYRAESNHWDWGLFFFEFFAFGRQVDYSDFLLENLPLFVRVGILPLCSN